LVVEDEPDLVNTYRRLLRRHGLEMTAATSLVEALAALQAGPWRLLIVDLGLPDGDGLDVVRAARALPAPAPVIVITGMGTAGAARNAAMSAGASAFLGKPFATADLTQLIQTLLEATSKTLGRRTMRVRELMNRNVIVIAEGASCRGAVAEMHRARVRHLPVVSAQGALIGVVTDRDLRHYLFSAPVSARLGATPLDALLEAAPVTQVMSAPVITVEADDDVHEAARVMRTHRIGSLPVTEGGRLAGMVTETDLLREICRADAGRSPDVMEIVVSYP
jgi:CBS domain-containing protein/CheY-like chemotaxis protein